MVTRLVNAESGVVVRVSDEKAAKLGRVWAPVDEKQAEPKKPTRRKASSTTEK